jgi:multidrug resistance efflux pump
MKKLVYILLVGVVLLLLITWPDEETDTVSNYSKNEPSFVVATSSLPVRVSGFVEATDQAVVSARTSGVITEYLVAEGSYVTAGNILVRQSSPVHDAQIALRDAEVRLTNAQQSSMIDSAITTAEQSAVVAFSAEEIAILSELGYDNRTQEAIDALLSKSQQGVTVLLDALQFVNTNRVLFNADSLRNYDTVVTNLYGSRPSHFQGGLLTSINETEDLRSEITELLKLETVSPLDVLNVQALLALQHQALIAVYEVAEADVLDRRKFDRDDAVYTSYFLQRTTLVDSLAELQTRGATVREITDKAIAEAVERETDVAVTTLERESAKRQAVFSADIASAQLVVAESARMVALAEKSLADVLAPFNGVVVKRLREVGEYATAGSPVLLLSGVSGKEMTVTVPAVFASAVAVGQTFLVDGKPVGVVERYSPVSEAGAVTIVIVLDDTTFRVGETVVGTIELTDGDVVHALPRSYVHFSSSGPYVVDTAGEKTPVAIVYDTGSDIYVTGKDILGQSLKPAYSISLQ